MLFKIKLNENSMFNISTGTVVSTLGLYSWNISLALVSTAEKLNKKQYNLK